MIRKMQQIDFRDLSKKERREIEKSLSMYDDEGMEKEPDIFTMEQALDYNKYLALKNKSQKNKINEHTNNYTGVKISDSKRTKSIA